MSCRVRVKRATGGGYVGSLSIGVPHTPGVIVVSGWSDSVASALKKAASVAKRITDDPIMSALIPPQAKAGIAAAKALAKAAEHGKAQLQRTMSEFGGPGKQRLAQALAKARPQPARRRNTSSSRRPLATPEPSFDGYAEADGGADIDTEAPYGYAPDGDMSEEG